MSTTLISYGCYFMLISLLIGEMMLSSMLMRRIDKQDEEIRRLKHAIQKKNRGPSCRKGCYEGVRELQRRKVEKVKDAREAEYDT